MSARSDSLVRRVVDEVMIWLPRFFVIERTQALRGASFCAPEDAPSSRFGFSAFAGSKR